MSKKYFKGLFTILFIFSTLFVPTPGFPELHFGIISAIKDKVEELKHKKEEEKKPLVTYDERTKTVTIPGATIITAGQEYWEKAPLPETGLALVIKDENYYFYSSKLGDLPELTVESSCKAIGYFLLANIGDESRLAPQPIDTMLKTGIVLKSIDTNQIECSNKLHRWAAIKVVPNNEKELLPPRKFFDLDIISIFEADWSNVFKFNRTPEVTVGVATGDKIETYGAIARLFLASQIIDIEYARQAEAIKTAFNSDKTIFVCLQVLDSLDLIFVVVAAVFPQADSLLEKIAREVSKETLKETIEIVIESAFTHQSPEKNVKDIANGIIKSIIDTLLNSLKSSKISSNLQANEKEMRDYRIAVVPILIPILKAIKIVADVIKIAEVMKGVYDEATHLAYDSYTISGGLWQIQIVDSSNFWSEYSSIALDTNNYPHISYCGMSDIGNGDLKYARWTGSTWDIQTVDSEVAVGWFTSIALDTNNYPHISYCDAINDDLKYAKWTGAYWDIQIVDSRGNVGYYTSIALDTNNYPHISYCDYADRINTKLKYARWTGSSWDIQTVDSGGAVGWSTSIALDKNNYPHISYYDYTNGDLKYARWVP